MNAQSTNISNSIVHQDDLILVTGSNGFIGMRVIQVLLQTGYRNIRCFVRPSGRLETLKKILRTFEIEETTEIVAGDLLSRDDCARAAKDVAVIYHLAAGFDKSFAGAFMNSALTTRNLFEAFATHGKPFRFVNVSSFAVYSNFKMKRNSLLDETSPLETASQERGDAYAFGKLKQEEIVRDLSRTYKIPFVVLRPGTVFGPGKGELTGRIGINTFGFFIHGGGSNQIPLTYVDNCADAIVLAGIHPGVEGETFNVVDDELLTSRQFLRAYRSRAGRFFSLPLPYWIAYLLSAFWEDYANSSKQLAPVFNRRRCAADWKGNRFSNRKLRDRLGWKPRVPMKEAMERFLAQFDSTT